MIESIRQQDLTIPVGGMQEIHLQGDRFDFLSASSDPFAVIGVKPDYTAGAVQLRPGQGFKFSGVVKRWVVYNRGAVPLAGIVLIGAGDFQDRRITGEVSVIDGEKARTLANTAFVGRHYQAALAGNGVTEQLWNPAGSGKNIILEGFGVSSATAQALNVYTMTVALAAAGDFGVSKMFGGAASVAQGRGTNGNVPPAGSVFMGLNLAANLVFEKELKKPIILRPGYGMGFYSGVANVDMSAFFEYFEEVA